MQRIKRFGTIDQKSGESIIYGTYREPIDLVMGMYIDDGVEDRIHRKHLMSEKFTSREWLIATTTQDSRKWCR